VDLEELKAFLAVVETGSYLAAERSLNMPRSTVRRRVDALEARAGVTLLHKSPNGVTPSEAGVALAARGRLMMQEVRALLSSLREMHHEAIGTLRILLPMGLPPQLLVPLYVSLHAANPRVILDVRYAEDPVASLLDDVDVAVHFGHTHPKGPWQTHPLVTLHEHLIATRSYLAAHGTPTTLEVLRNHDLLMWAAPQRGTSQLPLLVGGSFPITPVLVSSDIHLLRQCALEGAGIALVPDAGLPDPGVAVDEVCVVLPELVGADWPLQIVVPEALAAIPKIRRVLDYVRSFTGTL
jgi:DNA-binding transcriptional LysR family regulator